MDARDLIGKELPDLGRVALGQPLEAVIDPDDLEGVETVGVTAGASTPEWLIKKVVSRLESLGAENANNMALK